jgi:hypothetical protein
MWVEDLHAVFKNPPGKCLCGALYPAVFRDFKLAVLASNLSESFWIVKVRTEPRAVRKAKSGLS